jgi:hypothetical protein
MLYCERVLSLGCGRCRVRMRFNSYVVRWLLWNSLGLFRWEQNQVAKRRGA